MYKYIFGPVPSRRLGMSLGVDLVPQKVCSLNCVYCECGKTTNLTTTRNEYVPYNEIINELTHYFNNSPNPDYITFSGAGEPTLNSRIGDIINFIKIEKPDVPIAVLTNGTLLNDINIRKELLKADVVLPSLDAASQSTFIKIDRPNHKLNIDSYIQGIIDFRKEFKGKIWLEVMILPDYNNNEEELSLLKKAFLKIKADSIQINTLDRPGTVDNLRSASISELKNIVDFWNLKNVEIIASVPERKNIKSYREDTESAILETIARRPCVIKDLAKILGTHINEINKYLSVLENENKIETIRQERGVFYRIKK
ncbi:MAG: radical SAM protein [Bacteroidales bacterium]|nr:radical SAM protein [Bacteroidales bacterium]MBN2758424.1 radical SAM protein [Bacteroidales bacterium]